MRLIQILSGCLAIVGSACGPTLVCAAVIFQSAVLGPTAIPREDLLSQNVPGANLNAGAFNGARFQVSTTVKTALIGGHFINTSAGGNGLLFAAIVVLEDSLDYPDSADLSTADVLGTTTVLLPEPSDEVFGALELTLEPGWYAVVFGSGLFGANGSGAALLNNADVLPTSNFGNASGFGWGERPGGFQFIVTGTRIPEPSALFLIAFLAVVKILTVHRRRVPRPACLAVLSAGRACTECHVSG